MKASVLWIGAFLILHQSEAKIYNTHRYKIQISLLILIIAFYQNYLVWTKYFNRPYLLSQKIKNDKSLHFWQIIFPETRAFKNYT